MNLFDTIKQTSNHIMTTRSLTSREDYPSIEGLSLYRFARSLKGELGQAIGIWEKTLDSVLVTNALGSLTKAYFYCPF